MAIAPKNTALEVEDPLAFLPRKVMEQYRSNQVIYHEQQSSNGLSLIIRGRVKITTTTHDGSAIATGIFGADEFFGESALVGRMHGEQATALERTTLMTWAATEI